MGKLAVRMCIGGGVLAVLIQTAALWMPFYTVQSVSPAGFLMGYPLIKYTVTLTDLTVETRKFVGLQDLNREFKRHTPERQAKKDMAKEKEMQEKFDKLPEKERQEAMKEEKDRHDALRAAKLKFKQVYNEDWAEFDCGDGRSLCVKIKLSQLASLFSNSAIMQGQALLPGFPGSHNTGFALYYGGLTTLLMSVVMILVQLLGCGYLYYYAEVKATKTARKGALVSFVAAPVMAVLVVLILLGVLVFIGQTQQQWYWAFLNAQGAYFPAAGFWFVLFNMLLMWMLVIFSRFWRMKRAERVRKQRKDEEEEEEFMRLMGIDPSAAMEEDSDDELTAEEESDDEESQPTTTTSGFAQPQVVYSAPAYGVQPQVVSYGAAQPQVVQVQPNVQRVYL